LLWFTILKSIALEDRLTIVMASALPLASGRTIPRQVTGDEREAHESITANAMLVSVITKREMSTRNTLTLDRLDGVANRLP